MTYTPTTWTSSTVMYASLLNNAETQYDEGYTYFLAHNHDSRYHTKTVMQATYWYAGNDGSGSGCDADKLYTTSLGNLHYSELITHGAPSGLIVIWSGSIASIPSGWYLCNGSNGTPDLRDKWVLGAGSTYSVGASGGSATNVSTDTINVANHQLTTAEMPSHRHQFVDQHCEDVAGDHNIYSYRWCGTLYHTGDTSSTGSDSTHGHSGSSVTTTGTENRPPSKCYAYIMKA